MARRLSASAAESQRAFFWPRAGGRRQLATIEVWHPIGVHPAEYRMAHLALLELATANGLAQPPL